VPVAGSTAIEGWYCGRPWIKAAYGSVIGAALEWPSVELSSSLTWTGADQLKPSLLEETRKISVLSVGLLRALKLGRST
jgi:hypothetical protein